MKIVIIIPTIINIIITYHIFIIKHVKIWHTELSIEFPELLSYLPWQEMVYPPFWRGTFIYSWFKKVALGIRNWAPGIYCCVVTQANYCIVLCAQLPKQTYWIRYMGYTRECATLPPPPGFWASQCNETISIFIKVIFLPQSDPEVETSLSLRNPNHHQPLSLDQSPWRRG